MFLLLPAIISLSLILSFTTLSYGFVRVDKMKLKPIITPGKTETGQIRIENPSENPLVVKIYLEDWIYVAPGNGDKKFMPAGTSKYSCASWITFAPSEFIMPPFSSQVLSYAITMPEDIKEGHYAIMFFETQPVAVGEEGVNVMVATRIGTLFYIHPKGLIDRSAILSNLSFTKNYEDSSLDISLDFKNTGNISQIIEKATYSIIDRGGRVYARGLFNNIYTFPNDTAKLTSTWKDKLPTGIYDIIITLTHDTNDIVVREATIEVDALGEVKQIGDLR